MKRYLSRTSVSLVILALVGLTTLTALAVPRAFHLVEHGNLYASPRDQSGDTIDLVTEGMGTATHLGLMTTHREAVLTRRNGPIYDVNGIATLTAANGEQLGTTFTGTLDMSIGHADLIYQWTGGSRKFENAVGTTIWSVEVGTSTYDAVADGDINF
ncbi:MAG TPA: hypothetical protein VF075_04655 [Pyrinomonadaceae bacterium]